MNGSTKWPTFRTFFGLILGPTHPPWTNLEENVKKIKACLTGQWILDG